MHYYVEITCLPDEGIGTDFILEKVMGTLHLCMVNLTKDLRMNPIGISFPEYMYGDDEQSQIGSKIRLFSRDSGYLEQLGYGEQLHRFSDYVHLRSVSSISRKEIKFAAYRRIQPKSSVERLVRRQLKRSNADETSIRARYQSHSASPLNFPYINMTSHSNAQKFRLYIEKMPSTQSNVWAFNSYGLSSETAVPDF